MNALNTKNRKTVTNYPRFLGKFGGLSPNREFCECRNGYKFEARLDEPPSTVGQGQQHLKYIRRQTANALNAINRKTLTNHSRFLDDFGVIQQNEVFGRC